MANQVVITPNTVVTGKRATWGRGILAWLVTTGLAGSVAVAGGVYFQPSSNGQRICYGSGCTVTQVQLFAASGTSTYRATLATPHTGSGVINEVRVTCRNKGNTSTLDVGTSDLAVASGANLIRNQSIGTGQFLRVNTGSTVFERYIHAAVDYDGGSVPDCQLEVTSDQLYRF